MAAPGMRSQPRGIRVRRRLLLAVALIAVCGGCTGRERKNPFDPLNPDTGGEPDLLRAIAGCSEVRLSWQDEGIADLIGFRVWRRPVGARAAVARFSEEPEELLTAERLPAEQRAFTDTTAANGTPYAYRVEFCFAATQPSSAFSAPREARPGAALPWSADACGWGLSLLTPDGGGVRRTEAFGSAILDLDVDLDLGRVFAAQIDSSRVLVYRASGERVAELEVAGASCVSWSATEGALAVGAFYEGCVSWLTADGAALLSLDLGGLHPEDVAFRDATTTWIALREGLLLRVDRETAQTETLAVAFTRPVAVADDPRHGCWVVDRGGAVVYVRDDGSYVRTAEADFDQPLDADADGQGCCWVADWGRGRLVCLNREAEVVSEIGGLGPVAGVTYDRGADALWVAIPERGVVLFHALRDGWQRRVLIGGCPRKVAGDWSGGCPPAPGRPRPRIGSGWAPGTTPG